MIISEKRVHMKEISCNIINIIIEFEIIFILGQT